MKIYKKVHIRLISMTKKRQSRSQGLSLIGENSHYVTQLLSPVTDIFSRIENSLSAIYSILLNTKKKKNLRLWTYRSEILHV